MSYTGKYEQNQIDPSSQPKAGGGCPFCGAEKLEQADYSKEVTIFDCWTKMAPGHENRGRYCYEHQIAQLQMLLGECWEWFDALITGNYPQLSPTSDMLHKLQEFKPKG